MRLGTPIIPSLAIHRNAIAKDLLCLA